MQQAIIQILILTVISFITGYNFGAWRVQEKWLKTLDKRVRTIDELREEVKC